VGFALGFDATKGPAKTADGKRVAAKPKAKPTGVELGDRMEELRQQMFAAAENLEFETAARIRDEIHRLRAELEGGHNDVAPSLPRPAPSRRTPVAAGSPRVRSAAKKRR